MLAQVHDHRNSSSATNEACTVFHEVGHLYGAQDHYDDAANGWTLDQLNAHDGDPTRNLFSSNCIYGNDAFGTNNANVITNLIVCEGCIKVIRKEIILPPTPPQN